MAGTRNGRRQGAIPFPGQQQDTVSFPGQRQGSMPFPGQRQAAEAGSSGQALGMSAPADDELVHRLSVILEEISGVGDDRQPPPAGGPRQVMRKASSQFAALRSQPNLDWLRRSVENSREPAAHGTEETAPWNRWVRRLAPLIALIALLSLYPAFRYVLTPAAQNSPTSPPLPERTAKPAAAAVAVVPNRTDAVAAVPERTGRVRVRTVKVIPQKAPLMAGTVPQPEPAARTPVAQQATAIAGTLSPPIPAAQAMPAPQPAKAALPGKLAKADPVNTGWAVRTPPDATEVALLERGKRLMAHGDVAGARLAYGYLADRGSANGALALAESYDPALLAKISVVGLSGDHAEALRHYRRAAELGSLEAARRLARLQGQ